MSATVLLGVDWGSSSVRAWRIAADGAILDVRRADDGVFSGSGAFDDRLRAHLGDWLGAFPAAPILLCGMIGSDRGWHHASYVSAPAGLDALAAALVPVPFERPAHIVPGLSLIDGATCEVMRGEETLLMGLPSSAGATVCLPGTHAKWARLDADRVTAFRTHMTGELRAALLDRGALAPTVPQVPSPQAFCDGLEISNGTITHILFQARARRLLGHLAPEHVASFVGGMLIGSEIASEMPRATGTILLVAGGAIAEAYGKAFAQLSVAVAFADPDVLAARGLLRLACRSGIVEAKAR